MLKTKHIPAHLEAPEPGLKNLVETVLNSIPDAVITINESSQIQSYNNACVHLFGYTCEEVQGKNLCILMLDPDSNKPKNRLEEHPRNEITKLVGIHEVGGQRKDGSTFPMEMSVGETQQGDGLAFIGVIRDISERHEAEKARDQLRQAQKMEALGQLTGGVAHDFNNLLAVILSNLDFMIEETREEDPLRAFIQPSIEAVEHGAALTGQLLAFGRKQALQPRIISVNDLLKSFMTLVRHTLGERIETILALEPEVWNVSVDSNQLQNALLNLAVNARDAMPKGGKLIFETKNCILDEDYAHHTIDVVVPGDYVMIAVSDTGEGMTEEVMEKAFEPFFTTKEVGKGSGLGLSMVYGFVKQSKGHVHIYSEVGHGTSFKIHLPRAGIPVLASKSKKEKPIAKTKGAKVILVVEDNPDVLKLTSAMAASLGYDVLQAKTGDAAMKFLKERSDIILLLTDVMLPGNVNGPELAKRATALYPNLKTLFNSGYAEHAIFQNGILEQGVHLISKPFRKQQLADKIEEVLMADV
jgi:PAS domain S-box-containing protein